MSFVKISDNYYRNINTIEQIYKRGNIIHIQYKVGLKIVKREYSHHHPSYKYIKKIYDYFLYIDKKNNSPIIKL